jgi:hypothetical protein
MTDFNILLSHPIRVAQRHSERVAKFLGFSSHQGAKSMSKSVKSHLSRTRPSQKWCELLSMAFVLASIRLCASCFCVASQNK